MLMASASETLIGITGRDFVLLAADTGLGDGSIVRTSRFVDKIHVLDDDNDDAVSPNILIATAGDAADADRLVSHLRITRAEALYEDAGTAAGSVTYVNCSSSSSDSDSDSLIKHHSSTTPAAAGLSVECVAEYARYMVWQRLRSQRQPPLRLSMLMAGLAASPLASSTSESLHQPEHSIESIVQKQVDHATASLLAKTAPREATSDRSISEKQEPKQRQQHPTPALYWLDVYGALQRVAYAAHGGAGSSSLLLWSVLDRGYRPDLTVPQALALLRECAFQLKARSTAAAHHPFCVKCLDASGRCRVLSLEEEGVEGEEKKQGEGVE